MAEKPALPLRLLAAFFSWVFHPLFLLTYLTAYLLYIHPYAFASFSQGGKLAVLASVFLNTAFLPGFVVLLMRLLGLSSSMELHTQRDRIIPLAATMIFYFWAWYVSINRLEVPVLFRQALMAGFLGVCFTWMLNIFYKISMHAVGAGGLFVFFLLISFHEETASGLILSAATLVAGIVASSRLLLGKHNGQEVYSGFMAGAICQFLAWLWYFIL